MLRKTVASLALCLSCALQAQPELSGTPAELEPFLNGLAKTVTFTATAREKVPINKAVIRLSVETEDRQLSDALKENLRLRQLVRQKLQGAGIDTTRINESRFSSTPEYGFFDERPKSFKVENSLTIEISDEAQMIAVATVSDELEQVHYMGNSTEPEDQPESNKVLVEKAIELVQSKAELFKSRLGVQLKVVEFEEQVIEAIEAPLSKSSHRSSNIYSSFDTNTSFGQSSHHATVSVTYEVLR